ncbi:AAA family ATPase [Pararhodobacter sp. SW119]|uniref:AAA family ATPase n=1 Tax=Pararhodobacter sp. SW119 TaxID=2780075 RepID=UPI001AE07568|nr:AAA family ATPase [Pararhodobacter sp. SW119]
MALQVLCRIGLLGPIRVMVEGEGLVRFPTRKVEALFGIIALAGDQGLDRDQVAALLWSRSPEGQARANLRQALAGARKALGPASEIVMSRGGRLALDWERATCDARDLAGPCDPDRLLGLGTLLEGLELREPPFEDWIAMERVRWTRLLCDRLAEVGEAQIEAGQAEKALAIGLRLIAFDDFNEAAHRLVMRALAATGERGLALRHFEAMRDRLKAELAIEPGTESLQLATELRTWTPGTSPPVQVHDKPPPAAAKVQTDDGEVPPAELRIIVAVAGRVRPPRGSSPDADGSIEEGDEVNKRDQIAMTVRNHGGLVLQNTGSGFLAVFGARASHSNDAERAILCSQAILSSNLVDGGRDWSLAIAAGRVRAEGVAATVPDVVGEVPERARDLVAQVPRKSIVVENSVRDATLRLFRFDPAATPHHWRVSAQVTGDRRPALTAFVGRDAEFARIRDLLGDIAARSECEVVVVRGEAGIGKTRLVEEIGTVAAEGGFRTLTVGALDFGTGVSEGLIARLARGMSDHPAQALSVLDRAIMADLTGDEPDAAEREMLATLDPVGRQAERARVMAMLLAAAAARSPVLVQVEDIHWAEPDAVALLAELADSARDLPVAFVLTTRPQNDPVDAAWRRRCAGARVSTIDLAPLRPEAARRLAASVGDLPDDLVESCLQRAQGNPLFLEHLLRSAPRLRGGQLPLSVQSVVQEDLDQLPAPARGALRAAAVLGQDFPPEACEAAAGSATSVVDDLLATGLVIQLGKRMQFVHALVREGIYASIVGRDRAAMHRRVADWFDGRDPVMRAEHLDVAGDPAAAGACLGAAGAERRAARTGSALRLVERALALAEDAETAARARLLHGELLVDLEQFPDAIAVFREVAAGDAETLCACRLGIAECLLRLDRLNEALACLDEAERLAGDGPVTRHMAMIPYLRATVLFAQGAAAASVASARRCQALARQTGDRLLEARALSAMADAEQACGKFRTAERAFGDCVAICEELGLRRYALINRKMWADLRFYDADFDMARQTLEAVRDEAKELGSGRAEMLSEHMLAYVDCAEAKYEDALTRARRGRELVEALNARRFVMNNACYVAMALTGLDRPAEALEHLAEGESVARALKVTWILPWVLAQRALAEQRPADAVRALEAAEALIRSGAGSYPLDFYRPAIDAAIRIGDWLRVQSYAAALAEFFAEERVGLADFLIRRAEAIAAAHLGHPDRPALAELAKRARAVGYHAAVPALVAAMGTLQGPARQGTSEC